MKWGAALNKGSVEELESVAPFESDRREGLDLPVFPADQVVVGRVRLGMGVVAGEVEDRTGTTRVVVAHFATNLEWLVGVATSVRSRRSWMPASLQDGLNPTRNARTYGPCHANPIPELISFPVLTLL